MTKNKIEEIIKDYITKNLEVKINLDKSWHIYENRDAIVCEVEICLGGNTISNSRSTVSR